MNWYNSNNNNKKKKTEARQANVTISDKTSTETEATLPQAQVTAEIEAEKKNPQLPCLFSLSNYPTEIVSTTAHNPQFDDGGRLCVAHAHKKKKKEVTSSKCVATKHARKRDRRRADKEVVFLGALIEAGATASQQAKDRC